MKLYKVAEERLSKVDMLRGLAALSVCFFHFTNGNQKFLADGNWLKIIGGYGWVGVEAFFIISGFIIPYSLFKKNYQYHHFPKFLLKRFIRIEIPYLVTIFIVLLLNYLSTFSPYYVGNPFHLDFKNLILHFFYLNAFFKQGWINPVFWTLAIEFQFYLLIGLIYPIITRKSNLSVPIVVAIFLGVYYFMPYPAVVINFISYFLIGIIIFMRKENLLNTILADILLVVLLGFVAYHHDQATFICSLVTSLILLLNIEIKSKIFTFLGAISYSIYLIHVPIGGRIVNLSLNFISNDYLKIVMLGISFVITIAVSYFFYLCVEKPALKLSKKI